MTSRGGDFVKRTWVRIKPASIPKATQHALRARLEKHAQVDWAKQCREVVVRFRAAFAYVDAFPRERQFMPGTTREQRERPATITSPHRVASKKNA
jgi:hypothetical protein